MCGFFLYVVFATWIGTSLLIGFFSMNGWLAFLLSFTASIALFFLPLYLLFEVSSRCSRCWRKIDNAEKIGEEITLNDNGDTTTTRLRCLHCGHTWEDVTTHIMESIDEDAGKQSYISTR